MKEKIIEIVGFNMEPERAELIAQLRKNGLLI